jgi:hypothetical protein
MHMRAMFGLVSLLVVLALAMMIFKYFEAPTIETGLRAQDQTRQISGRGDDGRPAMESFQTTGKMRAGNLESLTVTSVVPTGALAMVYGLQPGDEILQVDGMKVGDISVNDPETAKAMVVQKGFSANLPILVLRNGKQITLPDKTASAGTAPVAPGGSAVVTTMPSAVPSNAGPAQGDAVKDQLKNLGIQTH